MRLFKTNKVLTRLTKMVDNAIDGKAIENGFDETKMSALETKLSNFLTATSTTKIQLAEEKTRINELISDISHQTKTPITNLLLYTQLLSERDLDPQDKECVLAIEQQAKKLEFLVNALVKTSRLENGIIVTTPKLSKVDELVEVVNAQVIPKAKEKGISLTTKECGLEALFDPKWVAEALYNIADNAIKYRMSILQNIYRNMRTYRR